VGIYGKITERIKISKEISTYIPVDFLWFRAIPSHKILKERRETPEGYILKTTAEMDELVYDTAGEYVFPVIYYIQGKRNSPVLKGFEVTLSISKFNDYIQMRDLWYRDYTGSRRIVPPEEMSPEV
jgi:hypothetical protein